MSFHNEANSTPSKCTASRPCNRFRTCARCARRRQAKIADAAENLASRVGQLRWHILYPIHPGAAALRAIRADWLRHAKPEGAIWTIEQSQKTGTLHCNILTPTNSNHEPTNAHHWHQTITGDPRAVGAYIAKRRQMPNPAAYDGRLYGTAGQLWSILANQTQAPLIAAAATQYALDSHAMLERAAFLQQHPSEQNRQIWARQKEATINATKPTRDEYRAIASRWLPDLLEWKEKHQPRTELENTKNFMIREGL